MLAARAAAEVIACNHDLRATIGGFVQDEIRVLASIVLVALLGEQSLAKAGPLDRLEVLLGDDHVGIEIDDLQGCRDALKDGELVHLAVPVWLRPLFIVPHPDREALSPSGYATLSSIRSMSSSESPKWWPISWISTWRTI